MKKISSLLLLGTSIAHCSEFASSKGSNNTIHVGINAEGNVKINSPTHHHTHHHDADLLSTFQRNMASHTENLHTLFESPLFKDNPASHAVLVIGPTGAGKSTFLNWLAGESLSGEKIPRMRNKFKLTAQNPSFKIGHDGNTGTFYPNFMPYRIEGETLHFWDIPGLHSVNGSAQDIIKIIELVKIVQQYDKLSILFTLDETRAMQTRDPSIINFLNQLGNVFEGHHNYLNFILTQHEEGNESGELFKENYLDVEENELNRELKEVLSSILSNPSSYFKMPSPDRVGPFEPPSPEFKDRLLASLRANAIERPSLNVSLNDSQVGFIQKYAQNINNEIEDLLKDSSPHIKQLILHTLSNPDQISTNNQTLRKWIHDLYEAFYDLKNSINPEEERTWRMPKVFGLSDFVYKQLNLKLESLKHLKNLSPDTRRVILARPDKWTGGTFSETFKDFILGLPHLERLALANPTHDSTEEIGDKKVMKRETFNLRPFEEQKEGRKNPYIIQTQTLGDITFAREDEKLSSTKIYTFPRYKEYPFETTQRLPYTFESRNGVYQKSTLKRDKGSLTGTATLLVNSIYKRPGEEERYVHQHLENEYPVTLEEAFLRDDEHLLSHVTLHGRATLDGVNIDVGEAGEDQLYAPLDPLYTFVPDSLHINHQDPTLATGVITRTKRWKRPGNEGIYEIAENISLPSLSMERIFEEDDDALESREILRISGVHETRPLSFEIAGRVVPYPLTHMQRSYVPGSLNTQNQRAQILVSKKFTKIPLSNEAVERAETVWLHPVEITPTYIPDDLHLLTRVELNCVGFHEDVPVHFHLMGQDAMYEAQIPSPSPSYVPRSLHLNVNDQSKGIASFKVQKRYKRPFNGGMYTVEREVLTPTVSLHKTYKDEEENLRSIPSFRFKTSVEGKNIELSEKGESEPYQEGPIRPLSYEEGSLNERQKTARLQGTKVYIKPGNRGEFLKETSVMVKDIDITREFSHNDSNLISSVKLACSSFVNGSPFLFDVDGGNMPYTVDVSSTCVEGSFNQRNKTATLEIMKSYTRGDNSLFTSSLQRIMARNLHITRAEEIENEEANPKENLL